MLILTDNKHLCLGSTINNYLILEVMVSMGHSQHIRYYIITWYTQICVFIIRHCNSYNVF